MMQLNYLIAALTLCLCLLPSESRKPPNDLSVTRFVTLHGSTTHTASLLGESRPTPDTYKTVRNAFLHYEESRSLGYELELNSRELQANATIMKIKVAEYTEGELKPHSFKPSQHIFNVLDAINKTELFKVLKQMPKGGVLHAHDTAICSTASIIKLTYRDNLWLCQQVGDLSAEAMRFAKHKPPALVESNCQWSLLSEIRKIYGAERVDTYLGERLTLYPTTDFVDINAAWERFMKIFQLLDGLLMYAPVWADYYYTALEEMLEDGVQYLEFRTTLPTLYDLDNKTYTPLDTVRIYVETLQSFMKEPAHKDFIGSRMIYAPIRNTDAQGVATYIEILKEIQIKYPDFLAGFDLVGQEDMGRPLREFTDLLLTIPDNINFYFHAAETNWYGTECDENIIDALLLGTKRIGHGFGLVKHPLVLDMVKKMNVAIEVNPVSNQVLKLVSDFRNHPCAQFFADGYPVVISSDDPSFWKASPLTHDFYIAFLGIASRHADLRLLKKLALNSIQYSSLTADQKFDALGKWQTKWDHFLDVVNNVPNNSVTCMNCLSA